MQIICTSYCQGMKNIKKKIFAVALFVIILSIASVNTKASGFVGDETEIEISAEDVTPTESIETEQKEILDETTSENIEETYDTTSETEEVAKEETDSTETETDKITETTPEETKPTPKPESNTEQNTTASKDTHSTAENYVGRFKIPSVGVNVACYAGSAQSIVDAKDSAAYFYGFGHTIIGDHKHQGFSAIKSCTVGTKATMNTPNGVESYTCVGIIKGHNTGTALTDSDYVDIDYLYPGALACYTCNENWQNVTIVFFMPDGLIGNNESKE